MTKYLIGVILLLVAICSTLFTMWRGSREDAIRWERNSSEIYNYYKGELSNIRLTMAEFKDGMDSKTDSILKVAGVKSGKVENITNVHNHFHDTVYVDVPVVQIDKNKYSFVDSTECFQIRGIVDVSLGKPKVSITDKIYDNESSYIVYQERRKWKCLFFKTRIFGKKQSELKVVNKCGDVSVQKIDIVK